MSGCLNLLFQLLGFAALGLAMLMLLSKLLESENDRGGLPLFLMVMGGAGILIIAGYGVVRLVEMVRRER